MLVVGGFVNNITSVKDYFKEALGVEEDVQQVLTKIVPELRAMRQSDVGNYPIELADQSDLTFYSDIDKDSLSERVRYFVSGTILKKGVITPTGSPLQYEIGNEIVSDVISGLATSSVFSYFDSAYTGTGTPMVLPINIPDVRMIKTTLTIDKNPQVEPGPFTLSRQVTIRNLRSNF